MVEPGPFGSRMAWAIRSQIRYHLRQPIQATVAQPMAVLNSMIAKSFEDATTELKELIASNKNRDDAVVQLISNLYSESKEKLYSGNSYSREWLEQADKKNLFSPKNTLDAISILLDKDKTKFLVDMKVLNEDEIYSRYRVRLEKYIKKIEIENSILSEMSVEFIIPAIEKQLTSSIPVLRECTTNTLREKQSKRVTEIEEILSGIIDSTEKLRDFVENPVSVEEIELKDVEQYIEGSKVLVEKLRSYADRAESIVSDEYWQLPKYRELLFSHRMR